MTMLRAMLYEGLLWLATLAHETVPYHRPAVFAWQGFKAAVIQADDKKGEEI